MIRPNAALPPDAEGVAATELETRLDDRRSPSGQHVQGQRSMSAPVPVGPGWEPASGPFSVLGSPGPDGRRLRIALLAAPMEPVPPVAYGGTERVVAALATELVRRGHDVTVFASGDSRVDGRLEPIAPQSLWSAGYQGDVSAHLLRAVGRCWAQAARFDIIHSHVEGFGFPFARHSPVPVVSTLHGRLDLAGMPELIEEFGDVPLVAISESQRRWAPSANWVDVVHNGLQLAAMPFSAAPGDYLAFVGRVATEKGVGEAIDLARRVGLPLRMAAKVHDVAEHELFDAVVRPAIERDQVEFLGELPATSRDPLLAGARATVMLGAWPEPFGLVAIESLATGTPVIARRAGALPEIVRHGIDGYLVDDLAEAEYAVRLVGRLDRAAIRASAIERFGAERMASDYERVYRRMVVHRGREQATPAAVRADLPIELAEAPVEASIG